MSLSPSPPVVIPPKGDPLPVPGPRKPVNPATGDGGDGGGGGGGVVGGGGGETVGGGDGTKERKGGGVAERVIINYKLRTYVYTTLLFSGNLTVP